MPAQPIGIRLAQELKRRGRLATVFRFADIQELKQIEQVGHLAEWLAQRGWGHLDVSQNEFGIAEQMGESVKKANLVWDGWCGVEWVCEALLYLGLRHG